MRDDCSGREVDMPSSSTAQAEQRSDTVAGSSSRNGDSTSPMYYAPLKPRGAGASSSQETAHEKDGSESNVKTETNLVSIAETEIARLLMTYQQQGKGKARLLEEQDLEQYTQPTSSPAFACSMGDLAGQKLRQIPRRESVKLSTLVEDADKKGIVANMGGYVYSVDWGPRSHRTGSQYLCVSASIAEDSLTYIGERVEPGPVNPGTIEIWSIDDQYEAKCRMVMWFGQGRISCVRWNGSALAAGEFEGTASDGAANGTLGLLAACMQDGSVEIISVPRMGDSSNEATTVNVQVDPLIRLNVGKGVPLFAEWHGADKLAVGYSDGWIAIWSVSQCLRLGTKRARPLIYSRIAASSITDLSWDSNGKQIFVSSYDGTVQCLQLSHPHLSTTLYQSRDVLYAVEYSDVINAPFTERPEHDEVRPVKLVDGKLQTINFYSHQGRVRMIATSPLHPYVASGAVDGTVRVADAQLAQRTKKAKGTKDNFVRVLFRLDRHRVSGEYRMIENLAPFSSYNAAQHANSSSVAWDPAVAISALRWNKVKDREGWVVSGTACGLLRIDVVNMDW